jgi:hypothetical protein
MRPIVGCTLLLAALASTACHTMKPLSLEQLNVVEPGRAWVTNADQAVIVVHGPRIVGDSLVGYAHGKYVHFASAGLKQVTAKSQAPVRTALLTAGIAAGVGVSIFVMAASGQHPDYVYANTDVCLKAAHPDDPACIPR